MSIAERLIERDKWIDSHLHRGRKVNVLPVSLPGTLERLSPWTRDGHCWLRTVSGGDPDNLADRRVFVEKSPRVFDPTLGLPIEDGYSWVCGDKGHADEDEGPDMQSRQWADEMAEALGYRLPDVEMVRAAETLLTRYAEYALPGPVISAKFYECSPDVCGHGLSVILSAPGYVSTCWVDLQLESALRWYNGACTLAEYLLCRPCQAVGT